MYFASVFSHSVACLLTFLAVSLKEQKFYILMKSDIYMYVIAHPILCLVQEIFV